MTTISASQVAQLRARTGAGILESKKALEEANGDESMAIDILRKKGKAQAIKKADRMQSEGGIFIATDGKKAAVVMLKCETDFVGRSDNFVKVGQMLAQALHDKGPEGFETVAGEKVPAAVLELGENISVGETAMLSAPVIGTYVHSNRKIGVVIGLSKGTKDQAVDAAMHAAAMSPMYKMPEHVPTELIAKEREIWKEQMAKDAGKKPPEILEKIMLGKEKKFREENALVTQAFVKDPSRTVGHMLDGAEVTEYLRVAF